MVIKLAKPSEIPQSWYGSEIGFDLETEDKFSMHLIVILHRNLFFSCKESLGNFSILCYNFLIFEM